ncbi:MAG: Wzz/FepE/Etk N-terminal domain-containing protein [Gammaproteobacteria bacterium]|nr:Wzz/FepE/Etk N-terminal domain-containing protein [Gammaproteobacteria bacterium]
MVDEREFLDEEERGLGDIIAALRRHKVLAILMALGVFVVGTVIVFALPTYYESTATILLEEPEVPEELVRTTVTTFAAQQIQYINQRVMTRTNLAQIIEKFDLYADKRQYMPALLLTGEVESNISLDLVNVELNDPTRGFQMVSTIAFMIGFEDKDPKVAQKVANELVSLYMEENVRSRTVQTGETVAFLTDEVNRLDTEVKEIEARVARFKKENEGGLPEMVGVNRELSLRTEDQLMDVQRRLTSIEDTRLLIEAQLSQIEPSSPTILPDGRAVLPPQDQMRALQTRLAMIKGQYSDDHPDVVRTQRELDALRADSGLTADLTETTALLVAARTDLLKARETYNDDHPEVQRLERLVASLVQNIKEERVVEDALIRPDNPAYISLVTQRNTLAAEEQALRTETLELRRKLADYESRLLETPKVEQAYYALQRELQTAIQRYIAMRERQFGAEMGEALEMQSKGERFVLVEPPNLPLEPSTPNRPALLLMLMILAPALGIGLVPLKESMDHAIWGSKMLDSIQGGPPIAEIPVILTRQEAKRARVVKYVTWAGGPAFVLLAAVVIHFAYRPLDVIWYVTLRKLGI